jgi:hypothetical protein
VTLQDAFGVREAVLEQNSLGWYNFLLGRLLTRWADAQQRYLESIDKRNTGRRWTIAILAKIWDISWDIWEQRNGIAHDTLHPRRLAQLQVLQQEVKDVFRDGCDDLLSRDKRLFDKGLEKILAGSDIEMRQWTTSVLLARRRATCAKEDYAASLRAERSVMQHWLNQGQDLERSRLRLLLSLDGFDRISSSGGIIFWVLFFWDIYTENSYFTFGTLYFGTLYFRT